MQQVEEAALQKEVNRMGITTRNEYNLYRNASMLRTEANCALLRDKSTNESQRRSIEQLGDVGKNW